VLRDEWDDSRGVARRRRRKKAEKEKL